MQFVENEQRFRHLFFFSALSSKRQVLKKEEFYMCLENCPEVYLVLLVVSVLADKLHHGKVAHVQHIRPLLIPQVPVHVGLLENGLGGLAHPGARAVCEKERKL